MDNKLPGHPNAVSLPHNAATNPSELLIPGHVPHPGSAPVAGTTRVPTAPTVPEADAPSVDRLLATMATELFLSDGGLGSLASDGASPSVPSGAAPTSAAPTSAAPAVAPGIAAPSTAPASGAAVPASGHSLTNPFAAALSFDQALATAAQNPFVATIPLTDAAPAAAPLAGQPAANDSLFVLDLSKITYQATPGLDSSQTPSRDGSGGLDGNALKREFPILHQQVNGKPLVWLDNAATTQKPRAVIDRLSRFYEFENSNIHRAAHTLAARATDAYEQARESVRRFIGAASVRDIVFVRGATEGINLVAQSWGKQNIGAGDEIVLTHLEHHANIVPWQMLAAEKGARLRVAPVDETGQIILPEYAKLLNSRTKLVAMTQVSNALGTITPTHAMVALAKAAGAKTLVDGAQAVSHMRVDVQSLGCDFYVFSGHKVFAPTGIGAVYAPHTLLDTMPPWQGGGNMIVDVTFDKTVFQPAPARFEAGTGNIADAVGLGAALDWLTSVGIEQVSAYEHELLEYGTAKLLAIPGLRMIGTAPTKAGVLSFTLAGRNTTEIGALLDKEGIAVRSGHHCAQPILRRFGVEATVRASLAPYNTKSDLDALAEAVARLA